MPKKVYTEEELKALKEQLFAEAAALRDKFKDAPEKFGLNVSDEQIRENIENKIDLYIDSNYYVDSITENRERNLNKIKQDFPRFDSTQRNHDLAAINEDQFEHFEKEVNTNIKNEHYFDKTIEGLLKQDYVEVLNCALDDKKGLDYALKNMKYVEPASTLTPLIQTEKRKVDGNLKKFMNSNNLLFETPYISLKNTAWFCCHPINFLYKGTHINYDEETRFDFQTYALTNKLMSYSTGELSKEDLKRKQAFDAIFNLNDHGNFEKLKNALEKRGIKNVIQYKAKDENTSLVDALLNDKEIVERSPEEMKDLEEEFNRYELAYIHEKIDNPESSNPVTKEELEKYNHFKENTKDFNHDILARVSKDFGKQISLDDIFVSKETQNAYNTFKNDMIENAKNFSALEQKSKTQKLLPSEFMNMTICQHRVKEGLKAFRKNLSENLSYEQMAKMVDADKFNNAFVNAFEKVGSDVFKNKAAKDQFLKSSSISRGNIMNHHLESLSDVQKTTVKQLVFAELIIPRTTVFSEEEVKNVFDKYEQSKIKIEKSSYPKPELYEHSYAIGDKADESYLSKEINDLRNNEALHDPSLANALNVCDRALVKCKSLYWEGDDPSENMGNCSTRILNASSYEMYKEESYFDKDNIILSPSGSSLTISEDLSSKKKADILKTVVEKRFIPDEKSVDKVMGLYNTIKQEGSPFDITNEFVHGPGISSGIVMWQTPLTEKLSDAVTNKDLNTIKNLSQKYAEYETFTDNLLKQIKDANPSEQMPGNTSSARNRYLPAKYRHDIVGMSRLNSLCLTIGYCERYGFDFNKLAKDPVKYYRDYSLELLKEPTEKVKNLSKGRLSQAIYNFTDGADKKGTINKCLEVGEREIRYGRFNKISEGLGVFYGEEACKQIFAQVTIVNEDLNDAINEISNINNVHYHFEKSMPLIKRFLLVEEKDRDFFKLHGDQHKYIDLDTKQPREKFNDKEYYKTKTSAQAYTLRSLEVLRDYRKEPLNESMHSEEIKGACIEAVNSIPEQDRTPAVETVRQCMTENYLGDITPDLISSLKNEEFLCKAKREGINSSNVIETAMKLAEVEKTYKNRGFFSKIFNANVKNEKKLIDSMYQKIAEDTKVDTKEIKNLISKGRGGVNDLEAFSNGLNNLQQKLLNEENIKNATEFKNQLNDSSLDKEDVNENEDINENTNNNEIDYDLDKSRTSIIIEEENNSNSAQINDLSNDNVNVNVNENSNVKQ